MNIVLRKLSLLEKTLEEKEIRAKIAGAATSPADVDLKNRLAYLIGKVGKY